MSHLQTPYSGSPFPPSLSQSLPTISVGHPPRDLRRDPDPSAAPWFEWLLPGVGLLRTHAYGWTQVDVRIAGARLQANLTTQVGGREGGQGKNEEEGGGWGGVGGGRGRIWDKTK